MSVQWSYLKTCSKRVPRTYYNKSNLMRYMFHLSYLRLYEMVDSILICANVLLLVVPGLLHSGQDGSLGTSV